MNNQDVARHLRTVAQLMSLGGANKFRVAAFENAARAIDTLREPVQDANLATIDGLGKSTTEVIAQFITTGTSERLEELGKTHPIEALSMTKVKGIGPVKAMQFHAAGIRDFDALVQAAEAGRLTKHGKPDEKLIREVLFARDLKSGRVRHSVASYAGSMVIDKLEKLPGVRQATVCGSVRRKVPTCKDVDVILLVEPNADREAIVQEFLAMGEPINSGYAKASVYVTIGGATPQFPGQAVEHDTVQVDIWMVEEWHHGAALVYATGSKDHCVALRTRAAARGLRLNEYGLFQAEAKDTPENSLAGKTEESVYVALGLYYTEPEQRDGNLQCR